MENNTVLNIQTQQIMKPLRLLLLSFLLISLAGCWEMFPKFYTKQNQQFVDSIAVGMHIDEIRDISYEVFGETAVKSTWGKGAMWDERCGEVAVCYYPESIKPIFVRQKDIQESRLNNKYYVFGRQDHFIGEGFQSFIYVIFDADTNLAIGWYGNKPLRLHPNNEEE